MSREIIIAISTLEELQRILLQFQVNYLLWQSARKDETHLLEEIKRDETILVNDPEYGLVRQTLVMNIQVRYIDPNGDEYRLREDRQEWHNKTDEDGNMRVDRRGYTHISEKIKASDIGEDGSINVSAITNALSEELDGVTTFMDFSHLGVQVDYTESPSFPGLKTKYLIHRCRVYLPEDEYRPEYVEVGREKSTFFVWERV